VETRVAVRHGIGMKLVDTEIVVTGLYASAPERLPFGRNLDIRSFVLQRPTGNLLVYSTRGTGNAEELGGIWRQYLNHWHEAGFVAQAVTAPLFVHAADRAQVAAQAHVRAAFSRRHMLDDDFEVIPTPGHTPGATAYLWDTGEQRILFTGDTVMLLDGEWVAAVLESSDRGAYLASLAALRELDFDVLVPWVARGPYFALTDPADRRRRLDAIIERLRRA
jgi:glyoxylase-like metal-dependent hydrolase (beta-lactamase superfamily II)